MVVPTGMEMDLLSLANIPFSSAILDCGGSVIASGNSLEKRPVNWSDDAIRINFILVVQSSSIPIREIIKSDILFGM